MWIWMSLGYGLSVLIMLCLWLIQQKTQRADLIDIGWTLGIVVMAWIAGLTQHGALVIRVACITMVTLWGTRLLSILFARLFYTRMEDPRYLEIRQFWGTKASLRFFGLFQLQAFLIPILSLPFFLASNRHDSSSDITIAACAIWLIGFFGVALADYQLDSHKKKALSNTVCQNGLWRYSRHPNYFFEWIIWISYFVLALPHHWGFASVVAPIIMFIFLRWITGVPPSESQSLRSRGDAYVAYQKTTSIFFPLPRKASANDSD